MKLRIALFLFTALISNGAEVALCSVANPGPKDRTRGHGLISARSNFLDRLSFRESHNNPRAIGDHGASRGAYQLSEAAWVDVSAARRARREPVYEWTTFAHHPYVSRVYAGEYLAQLETEFRSASKGQQPTERQLIGLWRRGYHGTLRRGFQSQIKTN